MIPHAQQQDELRPTVLSIDDSVEVHRLLAARLKGEDLDLIHAGDGSAGCEKARTCRPAIILLDLDMPEVDGFEVLRRLKNDAETVHIPVIVLSGLQSSQDKVTAFDLGAVDFIPKPFDPTELRVRVRVALKMHRLLQMLAQRAQIDGLTGLWNRAHFDHRWREEVAGCLRHRRPLSLAMMDVDHFKSVNDTHGHPAGDAVLEGLARILRRECRASDIACRYGGEEFAIIMPDTRPVDAATLCERIRARIAEAVWTRHPEHRITISIGLAGAHPPFASSAEQWIEVADRNLYQSKRAGRNRMTVADVGLPPLRAAG